MEPLRRMSISEVASEKYAIGLAGYVLQGTAKRVRRWGRNAEGKRFTPAIDQTSARAIMHHPSLAQAPRRPLFKSKINTHHSAIKPAGFDVSHEVAKARRNWMDAESCFIISTERESALLMPAREWGGLSWSNSAKNHGVGVTSRRTKLLPPGAPGGRV